MPSPRRDPLDATGITDTLEPITSADHSALPVPGLLLVFSCGVPVFRPIPLPPHSPVTVGRSSSCNVVIDDKACSSRHVTLSHDGATLSLHDEQSRNGTFVDGVRVSDLGCASPRRLRIGKSVFLYSADLSRLIDPSLLLSSHGIVAGRAMRNVLDTVANAAALGIPLLACAETGTGKEIVARSYHAASRWARGELVTVNSAVKTSDLDPSLFFGAAKGVHSGAHTDQKGYFERAHHGTLFIDEIGEMPAATQAMLLRVLDQFEVVPLGGKPMRVELGLVTATNRDLEASIAAGEFRRDFYHRIARALVQLPPLRDRPEEIPFHLVRWAKKKGSQRPVSAELVDAALAYGWPGNVRELEGAVERAMLEPKGDELAPPPPAPAIVSDPIEPTNGNGRVSFRPPQTLEQVEESRIRQALVVCHGNQTKAAEMLGMARGTLRKKMEKYGIE